MSDFPVVLTNAVDGVPGVGTPIVAKHLNNLEAKVGINGSETITSLDYLLKNPASTDPGHQHSLYIEHALATAANDFVAASGSGAFVKKTLAETKTILSIPTAASQADQETGTEAAKYVTPAVQQFHPSAAKMWCMWPATSTPTVSYNVTSITDTGVGDWTVNIATDFSSTNYVPLALSMGNTIMGINSGGQAAGSIRVISLNTAGAPSDPANAYLACLGDQ